MQPGASRRRLAGLALATCIVFSAVPAAAQFERGQISGVVKDQSGGVIPGATVTVTNAQTRLPEMPSPIPPGITS